MERKILIGLGGPTASGKTSVAQAIVEKHGALSVKYSDLLIEDAKRIGVEIDKASLQELWLSRTKEFGPSYLNGRMHEHVASVANPIVVIEGNRRLADGQFLLELGKEDHYDVRLMYIDAPVTLRHERYNRREDSLGNPPISFEEFMEMERHPAEAELPLLKEFMREHGTLFDTGELPIDDTVAEALKLLKL